MLTGEIGLRPPEARALSWPEVDCILHGHAVGQQTRMLMPRQIAWETHNLRQLMSEKPDFSPSPQTYMPLPLVDRPAPTVKGPDLSALAAFHARMAARAAAEPLVLPD